MNQIAFPPIDRLLPHDPPMIVIDRVIDAGENWIRTATDIDDSHMFFEPALNGLPGWAVIELMAQTVAAFAGLQANQNKDSVRIGFLLGTRKMNIALPVIEAGRRVDVRACREFLDTEGLASFRCIASIDDLEVADALINVYQSRDGEFFRE